MRRYTVHWRRSAGDPDRNLVLIREAFSWLAFLFAGFWALWHRMWLIGVGLIAADIALDAIPELVGANPWPYAVFALAMHVIVGFVAGDLQRRALDKRGYEEVAVVGAAGLDDAETRFLEEAGRLRLGMAT